MQPAVTALKWILIEQVTMVYPVQLGVRNQRDKQDDDDDDDDVDGVDYKDNNGRK